MYPSWYVPLGFDKVYPGGVTGAVVRVWADNGQVSSINPMIYGADNEETTAVSDTTVSGLLPNAILAALIVGTVGYYTHTSLSKKRSLKIWTRYFWSGLACRLW